MFDLVVLYDLFVFLSFFDNGLFFKLNFQLLLVDVNDSNLFIFLKIDLDLLIL